VNPPGVNQTILENIRAGFEPNGDCIVHLRELVEILGKPTGWREHTGFQLENCIMLEWQLADGAVLCVMSTESESALVLERAFETGQSLRWMAQGLDIPVAPATDPRDNPIAVLAEFLE
jgi:hypothetical protein